MAKPGKSASRRIGKERLDALIRSLKFVAANMASPAARRIARNDARCTGRTNVEFSRSKRGDVCKQARAFMVTLPDLAPDGFDQAAKDAREFADMLSAPLVPVADVKPRRGRRMKEFDLERARA